MILILVSARVVVFGPWVNVDSEAELLTLCESLIDPLVVMPRKYSISHWQTRNASDRRLFVHGKGLTLPASRRRRRHNSSTNTGRVN